MTYKLRLVVLMLSLTSMISVYAQPFTYYVDQQNGNDSNNGTSVASAFETFDEAENNASAGDTIEIIGEYTNPSYNPNYNYVNEHAAHIWHAENTIRINNLNGSAGNYITIKAHDNNTILKGDGANIFRVTNSSYLIIEDFNIEGEVDRIPLSTANNLQFVYIIDDANLLGTVTNPNASDINFRNEDETNDNDNIVEETDTFTDISNLSVKRPTYIDTRGLYVSNSEQIIIRNNHIHHTPGGGLRVANSKYVDILENEVNRCSALSYTGTHGLVVSNSEPIGTSDYSIKVLRNEVHHNYNEQFSWSPGKTIITPRIDEGKGISLQRNNITTWINGSGRILVANNLCYWNGFSGVHSNDGYRIDFINNTCYLNSYTNTITYAGQTQQGRNIGISSQSGNDIKMINNISVIDTDWDGYALAGSNSVNLEVSDNIIFGINGTVNQDTVIENVDVNTTIADPLFVDATNLDFNLQSGSPAIGMANVSFAPSDDFFGNTRDANPDLGALEYVATPATTYTYNGSWSPENPSGISTSNDIINIISGNASNSIDNISDETQANTLSIVANAKLVINTNGGMMVENFDNQGTLTIRSNATSFGTFITNNIINNGILEYRRYVNAFNGDEGGNDLISTPLYGQTFGNFVLYQSNEDVIFSNPSNVSQKLFGPFDNILDEYLLYDTDTSDSSIILESGIGYRTGSEPTSNNIFVFRGDLEIGTVNLQILDNGPDASQWNLIGNPYTANIDFEDFFDANKAQFDIGPFQAIYGYNDTSNRWTIWNQLTIDNTSVTELIVPGQAFFVASKPDNGIVSFTPTMRRTGFSDDFILNRSTSNAEILRAHISIEIDSEVFGTDIYFSEGQTNGLDVGYDAGAFDGVADGIFTKLVEDDNDDIEYAIQSLPISNINTVVVPLGVKANQGLLFNIRLDAELSELTEDIHVYLEDTQANTWTLLNENDYKLTPNTDINGVGRYVLHFQPDTLSQPETESNMITMHASNHKLYVNGFLKSETTVEIYDLLGRKPFTTILSANTSQNITSLKHLIQGLYVVSLKNNTVSKVQKILVK